jgi:thiamine-monophosphate kinase
VKVSELGEFGVIDRLAEVLATQGEGAHHGRLFVGVGDDAAVWIEDGRAMVATTDALVEDVHFVAGKTGWRDLGWKTLAVNVSDIAAMGARPEIALVTLCLPPEIEVVDLEELYRGLAEASETMGIVVAGGDIVRARELVVCVAATGYAELEDAKHPKLLRRNAAREGDVIAVSGTLGGAAGGLRVVQGTNATKDAASTLLERHFRPRPRVDVGVAAISADIRCGMDVSDGLMQDLGQICKSSRVGAVVWADKLPVEPALRGTFEDHDALAMAATGGEDYELLLTGTQVQIDELAGQVDVPISVIGEMVLGGEPKPSLLDSGGQAIELPPGGWDHLRSS